MGHSSSPRDYRLAIVGSHRSRLAAAVLFVPELVRAAGHISQSTHSHILVCSLKINCETIMRSFFLSIEGIFTNSKCSIKLIQIMLSNSQPYIIKMYTVKRLLEHTPCPPGL